MHSNGNRVRPCACDLETCRLCWLFANDQRYRTLWGGTILKKRRRRPFHPIARKDPVPSDCIHLGVVKSRTNSEGVACGCENKWLRECDKHGLCRVNQVWEGHNCQDCAFYWSSKEEGDPPEVGSTRNLVYFICPISGNGLWQWNLEQLRQRIELFNGKRVIAIATGSLSPRRCMRKKRIDPPEMVEQFLQGLGCEFVHTPGHSKLDDKGRILGEVVAWEPLWSRVLPGGYGDATFYAHAKGVSKPGNKYIRRWAEVAYESNLDYWPLAQRRLEEYPVAGSFKKIGHCFDNSPRSSWHYGGTFFWVRNREFAKRDWKGITQGYAGTEAHPGVIFSSDEAGCMFHEAYGSAMNCYDANYWESVLEPQYQEWKHEHACLRLQPAQGAHQGVGA